ncbi:Tetratricopeptide-like helical domain superfamily [Sesbania bispinosa]|nr:Tetratricopeptide-like helical domain superfamily [Sesbania bispinosa]
MDLNKIVLSKHSLVHMYATVGDMKASLCISQRMYRFDVASWTYMIAGYHKCGDVEFARQLFERMLEKNLMTWSPMISGYARYNQFDKAVELFQVLQAEGVGVKRWLLEVSGERWHIGRRDYVQRGAGGRPLMAHQRAFERQTAQWWHGGLSTAQ